MAWSGCVTTTAMILRSRLASLPFPRLAAVALLTLAPKCLLCAAAYAGLGAALGVGGPEICGAAPDARVSWLDPVEVTLAAGGFLVLIARQRRSGRSARLTSPASCR